MTAGAALLIRLGSMGDVVLATGAAEAWRRSKGAPPLDVLVKEEWAALLEGHPAVRRIHAWPRGERGVAGVRAMAARLAKENYTEVVDLQASPRTRLLAMVSGWRNVRRPPRHSWARRRLVRFKRGGPPAGFSVGRSFVEAAVPGAVAEPRLQPPPRAVEKAADLLPEPGTRVGLVPGARHATKRWPLERFVEVGRELAASGWGPVPVFLGPDEDALLEALGAAWPARSEWLPIRESLPVTAALLGRCAAVVTNDTGLMHVAAAMGTPVIALFGPTVRAFGFAPRGENHEILEAELPCRPCSVHGTSACPEGHFRCMLALSPTRVLEAAHRRGGGASALRMPSEHNIPGEI